RDRRSEEITRGAPVTDEALGQYDPEVAAGEPTEDGAATIANEAADRRLIGLLEVTEYEAKAREDGGEEQTAGDDPEQILIGAPAPARHLPRHHDGHRHA